MSRVRPRKLRLICYLPFYHVSTSFSELLGYTFQFLQLLHKFLSYLELVMPVGIPNKEPQVETETHPVTGEAKASA